MWFCTTSTYLSAVKFPRMKMRSVLLFKEIPPQTISDPPPYATVCSKLEGRIRSPLRRHTLTRPSVPESKNIDSENIIGVQYHHHHHHHIRLNNPGRITASLKIFRQASLFLAVIHQLVIFSRFTSSMIPSIRLNLGLPTLLPPSGLYYNILLTISLSFILWICPAHFNLDIFISVIISGALYRSYNSLLYFRRHSPFS